MEDKIKDKYLTIIFWIPKFHKSLIVGSLFIIASKNRSMKPLSKVVSNVFHPHMYKMGPWGSKHYIFGDHFYSKNTRKLRFHVFLQFDARKHMISSFYLKRLEFTKNCEFVQISFGSPGTYNWNKIHDFLSIWSTSGKIMMSYIF